MQGLHGAFAFPILWPVGLQTCEAPPDSDRRCYRCKGLSLALVRHTMAAIGPLLAASDLRSLTLATWLYDVTLLQHVPSSLEVP